MDISREIDSLQKQVLELVTKAAKSGDLTKIAWLSNMAQQYQAIGAEARFLEERLRGLKGSLNGGPTVAPPTTITEKIPVASQKRSPKIIGASARDEWVSGMASRGIHLTGHGKRYKTPSGRLVGIAYANELEELPDRWFLGLKDEPTDVVVLLCRAASGKLYDLVIPMRDLGPAWRSLTRSRKYVKFHLRRDGSKMMLLVPGANALDVTKHVGEYGGLR